jgi:tetratricopeptide (TPR) repeat protein
MSYINDALQKAQKENESNYAAYGNIISAAREKEQRPDKRHLIAHVIILSGLTAVLVLLLTGQASKEEPAAKPSAMRIAMPSSMRQAALNPVSGSPREDLQAIPADTKPIPDAAMPVRTMIPDAAESEPIVLPANKTEITDPDVIFARAMKKQAAGRLTEAKELYRKVLKIDPRNVQALNNLGVIYLEGKNYGRAVLRFNDALAIKPDYADAHYNLACLYCREKDLARSLTYLKKAAGINPDVLKWAKSDSDLRELSKLSDFNNLLEEQEN